MDMATVMATLHMVTDIWDMLVTMVTPTEPTIPMRMVTRDMVTLVAMDMAMVTLTTQPQENQQLRM